MKIDQPIKAHKLDQGTIEKDFTSQPLINLTMIDTYNYLLDIAIFVPQNINAKYNPGANYAEIIPGVYLEYKGEIADNDKRIRRDFEVSYKCKKPINDYMIIYSKVKYMITKIELLKTTEAIDINLFNEDIKKDIIIDPVHRRGTKSTAKVVREVKKKN